MASGEEHLPMLEQADVRHHSTLVGLPPHLQKLHRRQQAAIRESREAAGRDGGWTQAEAEAAEIECQQHDNMEAS